MRSSSFTNSLGVIIPLLISCSNGPPPAQADKQPVPTDLAAADTTRVIARDTLVLVEDVQDTARPVAVPGDSVSAQSSRTEQTGTGTVSKHTGAVRNPGPDQALTDSLKREKTKGKKKP